MQSLSAIFPASDFTLLAFIVALPLIGAMVNGLFGKRLGREAVTTMALFAVGVPFLGALLTFFALRGAGHAEGAEPARFAWHGWTWLTVSGRADAHIPINVALSVDQLSSVMILVITGVGFLIHLYSTKYMEKDPSYHRFFAYLNLFVFSMLVLVLGDSLPVLFVGWEGVGLCSYLLIGFWFEDDANAAAGKKAFIANRIGDFGLLVAMGLLIYYVGALDWRGIESGAQNLMQRVQVWPLGARVPLADLIGRSAPGFAAWLSEPRYATAATLVALALFLGACGKSAQIPLYVWLPDAMAGPTPVSALIHAATMVTAGVYLVCRTSAVFVLSPAAMFTVALVGASTALFAATIAVVQNDIKKVLAYSTVSQLGYMFLGVGVGAFSAGFFHVLTHAFFKACLFLGAGSVIHAMHVRIHDTNASQDMRNMGGLKRYLPITFLTFVAAWAAIVGFPLTSGFFSKDEILFKAYVSQVVSASPKLVDASGSMDLFTWPTWGGKVLFGMGVTAALLTAFYMTRLVIGTFLGEFKGWTISPSWQPDEHDDHGHGHDAHHDDEEREGPEPHESPWQITLPLVLLGVLSLLAGALNAHAVVHSHVLDDWLKPVFEVAEKGVREIEGAEHLENVLLAPGIAVFLGGVGAAAWVYVSQRGEPAARLAAQFPGLHQLLIEKWRVDELYEEIIIGPIDSLAEFAAVFDRWVIDGILAKATAFIVTVAGSALRLLQTGRTHAYATVMVFGMGGLGWFFASPHPRATLEADAASGKYSFTAAPGLGYAYRWETDGDSAAPAPEYGQQQRYEVTLSEYDKPMKVTLYVKNAFGREGRESYVVTRARPDLSGGSLPGVLDVGENAQGQRVVRPRGLPQGGGQ